MSVHQNYQSVGGMSSNLMESAGLGEHDKVLSSVIDGHVKPNHDHLDVSDRENMFTMETN